MTNRERELYIEYKRLHPWATPSYVLRLAQALAFAERVEDVMEWPKCSVCSKGVLLPLSDYAPEGSFVLVKAWACANKACRYIIRIDKGVVTYIEGGHNGR